ncbi:MAG TPA: serine/threonine protein kinase, partial [Ktedonobacter sp.]|nr:serine/threonine protein kinase [Ktedonobacter sp.]
GIVYASSKNGRVYALHEDTGTLAWSTPIGQDSNGDISTQAVSDNGTLYVGTISGNLYALNALTGAKLWKTHAASSIFSSPAVANGVVYFSSFNKIYALNASTGAILWNYLTGANSYSSPIVVNGWLYWGSGDGTFYGFSL